MEVVDTEVVVAVVGAEVEEPEWKYHSFVQELACCPYGPPSLASALGAQVSDARAGCPGSLVLRFVPRSWPQEARLAPWEASAGHILRVRGRGRGRDRPDHSFPDARSFVELGGHLVHHQPSRIQQLVVGEVKAATLRGSTQPFDALRAEAAPRQDASTVQRNHGWPGMAWRQSRGSSPGSAGVAIHCHLAGYQSKSCRHRHTMPLAVSDSPVQRHILRRTAHLRLLAGWQCMISEEVPGGLQRLKAAGECLDRQECCTAPGPYDEGAGCSLT